MAKKYSVNMENDEIVSVEVDGVQYDSLDQIPDPDDRDRILQLIAQSSDEDFNEEFDEAFGEDFDKDFEEEFRELERQSARSSGIIVAVFIGVAMIMLAVAGISAANAVLTTSREVGTPGHVVELTVRRSPDSGQEFYYPVVEFYLPDGTLQRVQLNEGSWPPAYFAGEAVTILYNPEQPRQARIQSSSSTMLKWILPGITGVLGVAFLGAALLARRFLLSEDEPLQAAEVG